MNQLSKQAKDAINTLQHCHAICLLWRPYIAPKWAVNMRGLSTSG